MEIIKTVYAATIPEECVKGQCAPAISGLEPLFANAIGALLALGGIALFIYLVIGGFKYLTSGGDPKAVEEAKKTLTYAIGGMFLIAAAFLILKLIETFTGAKVTEFKIFQGQ